MKCAFAPGHVTGLFAVHTDAQDPLARGSRGGGWSLDRGAHAAVAVTDGPTRIRFDGRAADAPVTAMALTHLVPDAAFDVDLQLGLPTGQGFGMSAAGTLAACLAAAAELDLPPERALEASHRAEVESGTGLGDAVGSWFGGGELRIKPGCPPHGWAMRIEAPASQEFLFCVLGRAVSTRDIITDAEWKQRTRQHADAAVDRVLDAGREQAWHRLLTESARFSVDLGLRPDTMVALMERLPDGVQAGQCMLGSTLWVTGATGDLDRAEALLEAHGDVLRAHVDGNGARLIRAMPANA